MPQWTYILAKVVPAGIFLFLAITDLRYKKISTKVLILSSLFLLLSGLFRKISLFSRGGGLLLGAFILIFCFFSHEALGYADGILITVSGVTFGVLSALYLCFFSMLFTAASALILLMTKRLMRKDRLPYLPFLLAAYICTEITFYGTI